MAIAAAKLGQGGSSREERGHVAIDTSRTELEPTPAERSRGDAWLDVGVGEAVEDLDRALDRRAVVVGELFERLDQPALAGGAVGFDPLAARPR